MGRKDQYLDLSRNRWMTSRNPVPGRIWLAVALVVTVLATGGWGAFRLYQFSNELLIPSRHSILNSPDGWGPKNPSALELPYEDITVKSDDGTMLRGWYVPTSEAIGGIVLVHGRSANRVFMLPLVPSLHKAGYDVFLFDLRGHGDSPERHYTFGVRESEDVIAAARWLRYKTASHLVGVIGVSTGGVASIIAACHSQDIRTVIAESPFSSTDDIIATQAKTKYNLPPWPIIPIVTWISSMRAGVNLSDSRPVECAATIAPRSLMIINVSKDPVVPPAQSRNIFDAAKTPKTLWTMDGDVHAPVRGKLPRAYIKKVLEHLEQGLF